MPTKSSNFTINIPNTTSVIDNDLNTDSTLNYILENNKSLDKENKQLRQEISTIVKKMEEEEEYNDSNQTKNNNLKMVLKNLIETKNIQNEVTKLHTEINTHKTENIKEYNMIYKMNNYIIYFLIFYNIIIHCVNITSNMNIIMLGVTCFIDYYLYNTTVKNHKQIKLNETNLTKVVAKINLKISEHKINIKKMSVTSDYLNDYIDMI